MQIRIKTLTGKEIEIDIDPTDEVGFVIGARCWHVRRTRTHSLV